MKDVMLDLETFGNGTNAVVVQVGACYFDRNTGEIGKAFVRSIDAELSVKYGFEIDAATIYWWLNQDRCAIRSLLDLHEKVSPYEAISDLNVFLNSCKYIWSHATFDFVILMNHYRKLNIKPYFHYRTARDLRTLVDLADIEYKSYERKGVHHNALDDCLFQVKYAVDCFNKLKGGNGK